MNIVSSRATGQERSHRALPGHVRAQRRGALALVNTSTSCADSALPAAQPPAVSYPPSHTPPWRPRLQQAVATSAHLLLVLGTWGRLGPGGQVWAEKGDQRFPCVN